ncbi:DUF4136 domain-containing protein [Variovorax dokdonensis]
MTKTTRWLQLVLLAALAGVLSGCATSWTIENDVTSYVRGQGATTPATYRFERLPSQQAQEARQLELEAVAAIAMAKVGLQRDEQSPRYAAQITARVSLQLSPWADPWLVGPGWGWGGWGGYGRPYYGYPRGWYGGWGGWYGAPLPPAQTWYTREVSVVLRELATNQVVYETRAVSDGPYADNPPVFAAMFQAAMQGYPRPLAGVRRVDVMIPLGTPAADAPVQTTPVEPSPSNPAPMAPAAPGSKP